MALKTASVTLEGDGLRLVGSTGSGHRVVLDDGSGDAGPRPAELVPLALAGCTAMDVISILRKKRQDVRAYHAEAAGVQMDEHPNAFVRIEITHVVEGYGIDHGAVARAIELSAERYCSVGATLSTGLTEVRHSYRIVDLETGTETTQLVLVEGPHRELVVPAVAS